jgi:hypothetical protein
VVDGLEILAELVRADGGPLVIEGAERIVPTPGLS